MSSKVFLDVGGRLFVTSKQTLRREADSYFSGLFCGDWKDSQCGSPENALFIDQDPDSFSLILDFLRYGHFRLPKDRIDLLDKVRGAAEYFQLQGLLFYLDKYHSCERIHFAWKALKDYNRDVSRLNITRHCESNGKFSKWLEHELELGRGSPENPVMVQVQYSLTYLLIIEYLRVGFIGRATVQRFDKTDFSTCFADLTECELISAAECLDKLYKEFMIHG